MTGSGAGSAHVTVTSAFMEDYEIGVNLSKFLSQGCSADASKVTPYTARDGSVGYIVLSGTGRFWRVYDDPDAASGRSVQTVTFTSEDVPQPTMPYPFVVTCDRAVVIAGDAGMPDQLVIVTRKDANTKPVWARFPLGDDGSVGEQSASGPLDLAGTLIFPYYGNLPAGVHYLLEIPRTQALGATRMFVRDLTDFRYYMVDMGTFGGGLTLPPVPVRAWQLEGYRPPVRQSDIPLAVLSSSGPWYRYLYLDEGGVVRQVGLTLNSAGPSLPHFSLSYLDAVTPGCQGLYVRQVAPGEIRLFLLGSQPIIEPDGIRVARATLSVMEASYEPAANPPGIGPFMPVSGVLFSPMPVYPPGGELPALDGAWYASPVSPGASADAADTELFIRVPASVPGQPAMTWTGTHSMLGAGNVVTRPFVPFGPDVLSSPPGTGVVICAENAVFQFGTWSLDGGWEVSPLDVDWIDGGGDVPPPTGAYRVGFTLTRDGEPAAGATLGLSASEAVRGLVNGRPVVLRPGVSAPVTVDGSGVTWATVYMNDRLSFARLRLSVLGADQVAEFPLGALVEDFFMDISGGELAGAKDPATQQPLLPDAAKADEAAGLIREVMALVPKEAMRASLVAEPGFGVTSDIPFRWIPAPAAASTVTTARPAVELRPMGASGDFSSWIGSVAEGIWDGIVKVATFIVESGKVVITFVIDGISYLYDAVIETYEQAMDAVGFVLNSVGAALGKVAAWLLTKLGFLFDWEAIIGTRDMLLGLVRDRVARLAAALPDPKTAFDGIAGEIEAGRDTIISALRGLKSNPAAAGDFGGLTGGLPGWASWFTDASDSVMPQVTWLIEKVSVLIPGINASPGRPDINGLNDALITVGVALKNARTVLTSSITPVSSLMTSWIANPANFLSSSVNAVVDAVIRCINAVLTALVEVLRAAASLFSLMRNGTGAILNWFEQPFPRSFFGGFYRGLTKRELSVLDVTCLCAAVPMALNASGPSIAASWAGGVASAGAPPDASPSAAAPTAVAAATPGDTTPSGADPDTLQLAFNCFSGVAIVLSAASAGVSAITKPDDIKYLGYASTGMSILAQVAAEACLLWENNPEDIAIAGTLILGLGTISGALFYFDPGTTPWRDDAILLAMIVYACLNWAYFAITMRSISSSDKLKAYRAVSAVDATVNAIVRYKQGTLGEGGAIAVFLIVFLIGGLKFGLYKALG